MSDRDDETPLKAVSVFYFDTFDHGIIRGKVPWHDGWTMMVVVPDDTRRVKSIYVQANELTKDTKANRPLIRKIRANQRIISGLEAENWKMSQKLERYEKHTDFEPKRVDG